MRAGKIRDLCSLRTTDPDVLYGDAACHLRPHPGRVRNERTPDPPGASKPAQICQTVMEAEILIYSSGSDHFYGPLKSLNFRGFFFDRPIKLPFSAQKFHLTTEAWSVL